MFGKQKKQQESFAKEREREEQKKREFQEGKELLESERIFREGTVAIRDLVAPVSFQVQPDFVILGDTYVRTMFVVTWPRYISLGWFTPVINFPAHLDVSMFLYPVSSEVILKQLRNRAGNIQAQLSMDEEKGMPRDPLREQAMRDIEKLRDDLTTGVEKFFQYALYVTVYEKSRDALDKLTQKIESIMGSKLVLTRRAIWQSEQGFQSTLPLGIDDLGVVSNLNSSPCASSFPFTSAELTSENGILYGINRHNNSLILFDRFSLPNANSVVFATSGAGKSYMVKLEILRSLMIGTDVIVIDPEREYMHLSDAVGGTYINLSLNSESKINPFDLPKKLPEGATMDDVIRSAVITVKGLLRIMLGQMTHQEDSLLDQALLQAYAKKDITADSNLENAEPPIMQDLQEVLEGMEGGADLALRLEKYTKGTFAGLMNFPTNIEMQNQFVVFSVRDLEDELRPVAVYMIVNYIWNAVRAVMKKRILTIDEAWWIMQYEDSAKFIFALVKRCRKYYMGVTTITQDVNDFLNSPYGQAIVTNSQLQILLKQSSASIDKLVKTFLLTEGERYLLLEAGVGEGIFFAGARHAAIKIIASYTEDQLITTDPGQMLKIEQAKRELEEAEAEEGAADNFSAVG